MLIVSDEMQINFELKYKKQLMEYEIDIYIVALGANH